MSVCKFARLAVACLAGVVLAGWPAQALLAQRYLTEFVGTSRVTAGARQVSLPTALTFEIQDNRRVGGQLSYIEQDNFLAIELETLHATATLAANGNCLVKLTDPENVGSLRLLETSFDENTFSLIGTIAVDRDGGEVVLDRNGFQGTAGFLRPLADATLVRAGVRAARLTSTVDGDSTLAAWTIDSQGLLSTALGHFGEQLDPNRFDLVATVNDTWIYGTGVSETGFVSFRAKVQRNNQNVITGYLGDYQFSTIAGKTLDFGLIAIAPE